MISTLDPKCALVLIDLQKGILANQTAHPVGPVLARASELASAFRKHRLPVVLVNVAGGAPGRTEQAPPKGRRDADWTELAPELNRQASDLTVTKKNWGAFLHTDLEEQLRDLGVTQVVIGGVATSIGVESTARQAYELGFNVTLATDAMTDPSLDTHENSIRRIFPRLGETGATAEIIEMLDRTRS